MDFTEALETLLPLVDDIYDRWLLDATQLREGFAQTHSETPITCTKGCGACCHFAIVPATAGEAFVLLARLLARGETLDTLHTRFHRYAKSYFAACQKWGGLPFTNDRQALFLKEKLPCPLLDTKGYSTSFGGHCGVFEARPLICDYFHSLDKPSLCAEKKPHATFSRIVERGEAAIEELRAVERGVFGRSALGHLPLLLAALCTQEGLSHFLEEYDLNDDQEAAGENGQHEADFELYTALMAAAGYTITQDDLHNLIAAQEGLASQHASVP